MPRIFHHFARLGFVNFDRTRGGADQDTTLATIELTCEMAFVTGTTRGLKTGEDEELVPAPCESASSNSLYGSSCDVGSMTGRTSAGERDVPRAEVEEEALAPARSPCLSAFWRCSRDFWCIAKPCELLKSDMPQTLQDQGVRAGGPSGATWMVLSDSWMTRANGSLWHDAAASSSRLCLETGMSSAVRSQVEDAWAAGRLPLTTHTRTSKAPLEAPRRRQSRRCCQGSGKWPLDKTRAVCAA